MTTTTPPDIKMLAADLIAKMKPSSSYPKGFGIVVVTNAEAHKNHQSNIDLIATAIQQYGDARYDQGAKEQREGLEATIQESYQLGAMAMREVAAKLFDSEHNAGQMIARTIRALLPTAADEK